MEVSGQLLTSVIFQTTQHYNLEGSVIQSHCCEKPKSNMISLLAKLSHCVGKSVL
jgi:hypothetical protein